MDIIIEAGDKASVIAIENKIYASDQWNQLSRYKSYLEKTRKLDAFHYKLLYLTLYGSEPSSNSIGAKEDEQGKKEFWQSISYRDFLREWLVECTKCATSHPLIREVLNQYLQLIKELTHQTLEEDMKEEIVELLMSGQNLKYVQELVSYIDEAKNRIMQEMIIPKIRELENKLKLKCEVPDSLSEKWSEFYFKKDSWTENNFYVGFMFDKKAYSGLYYYINQLGEKRLDEKLLDMFKKIGEHFYHVDNGDEFPWWELEDISYDCTLPIWCFTEPEQFVNRIEKAVTHLSKIIDEVLVSY